MKSKLFVLLSAVLLTVCATNVYAQAKDGENNANEGTVTLNIKLNPIQSLIVNTNQAIVGLEYKSLEDYEEGVTSTQEKHLSVTSTGAYIIKVKATDFTYSTNNEGLNPINLSQITLNTTGGADKLYNNLTGLQKDDQQIVQSTFGGVNQEFNVTYGASGGNEYLINNYVKGVQQDLSTTVTYTIYPN